MIVRLIARRLRVLRIRAAQRDFRRCGLLFWRPAWTTLSAAEPNYSRAWCPVTTRHREEGQTLIEVALVLPIILVFLLVIVDFGFAFDRREVIQHAVREGARTAAVGNDFATVTDHTIEQSGGILTNIQVCYVDENGNVNAGNAGDSVRVSGEYTYEFMIGSGAFLSAVIPDIIMAPSSQARLEKAVPGANSC